MTAKRTEKIGKVPLPHPARRPPLPPRANDIRFSAPPVARFVPTKAVGSFVPTLTRKAFEKFGFSTAALITDWAAVAGAEIASYTMPERLRWPRGAESAYGDEMESERRGATLMLRVDPARALDVEYRARQIVERINAYFGYRAVETLRIVQAPVETASDNAPTLRPSQPAATVATSPDTDPLTAALARLEQGVHRDRAARRT
ncbi:DciA family protein [Hyphomicrobium sp.]|mgnify:CR=1 FL=1|uniref:DUF721 domain-containing protein n=1 Tax=Hyphomicrobium sp. TaxID=82 RepID=UPI002C337C12|nr:DciA family protein [Hyphomicrobium sp.]HRN89244.1 DciA family protein [Hyphomicrobium sp.]HRQ27832.1 DciA family protein [Hyphomicrobium sp.]